MIEGKRILVQAWLTRSLHDLRSAQRLANDDEPILDTAVYHCQQAAEKAVKAFLVYHDTRFEKTHDIEPLVDAASSIEPSFSDWIASAQLLTPYATAFRYPGAFLEPAESEFESAFCTARDLYAFVLSLLPEDVHPDQ